MTVLITGSPLNEAQTNLKIPIAERITQGAGYLRP